MSPLALVPADVLAAEVAYVADGPWYARPYRAARAAWRCARIAARSRR